MTYNPVTALESLKFAVAQLLWISQVHSSVNFHSQLLLLKLSMNLFIMQINPKLELLMKLRNI